MTGFVVYETEEYGEWVKSQTLKSRQQIQARILKIEEEGHFGHNKFLGDREIWELKFNDGRRIYYAHIPELKIILLLGGNKNGQDKDIKKAASILKKLGKARP